jgi:hypothetical protein
MRRLIACVITVIAFTPIAAAQTPARDATHRIAVVLRVPMFASIVDLRGRFVAQPAAIDRVTRSLLRWTQAPLDDIPVSLAVSPSLCEALGITQRGRRPAGCSLRCDVSLDAPTS